MKISFHKFNLQILVDHEQLIFRCPQGRFPDFNNAEEWNLFIRSYWSWNLF